MENSTATIALCGCCANCITLVVYRVHFNLQSGPWVPRKIPNPAYFYDEHPARSLAPIAALAVEVWTTSAAISFDNFVVTDSLEAAQAFARGTYALKRDAEKVDNKAINEIEKIKRDKEARDAALGSGDIKVMARYFVKTIGIFIEENPKVLWSFLVATVVAFVLLQLAGREKKAKILSSSKDLAASIDECDKQVANINGSVAVEKKE